MITNAPSETAVIYIDNYKSNELYVFNDMNQFISYGNYHVAIKQKDDPNFIGINQLIDEGKYSGNIIFNYPNARYIFLNQTIGTIVAPKADVFIPQLLYDYYDDPPLTQVTGVFLVNSITGNNNEIDYSPKIINTQLMDKDGKQYIVEPKDYDDDYYTYDYSLKSLLQNYNIVSFGKKDYDSKSKFKELRDYRKGSVGIFHIDSQFLINGDLGIANYHYPGYNDSLRIDLESNYITESHISGAPQKYLYIKYWKMAGDFPIAGSKNKLLNNYFGYTNQNVQNYEVDKTFINYDRLYENIIAQSKAIYKGKEIKTDEETAHIKIGGNYVIEDINQIKE